MLLLGHDNYYRRCHSSQTTTNESTTTTAARSINMTVVVYLPILLYNYMYTMWCRAVYFLEQYFTRALVRIYVQTIKVDGSVECVDAIAGATSNSRMQLPNPSTGKKTEEFLRVGGSIITVSKFRTISDKSSWC